MRALRCFAVLLLVALSAHAQALAPQVGAADAAVAAFRAGDTEAVRTLAAKDAPDPWLVADELLRRAEAEAAAAESRARLECDRALKGGEQAEIRQTTRTLDDALDLQRDVVARIQREAKRAAGLFYPRAATMEEIEGWLDTEEALVLYGLCLDEALALVLLGKRGLPPFSHRSHSGREPVGQSGHGGAGGG